MSRYQDPLAPGWNARKALPEVVAEADLVVEDAETGFCGAVICWEKQPGGAIVVLEDRHGRRRSFPLGPGFLCEGQPVRLIRSATQLAAGRPARTASGSIALTPTRARVARESRIYVEGRQDAELVERIWGDDLRVEGVAVEFLGGIDDLPAVVRDFRPGPGRRLGVLVDHLVPGSKETRIAAAIGSPDVRVLGHPYIDVWQAVKPSALGIDAWPVVPPGRPWKSGVMTGLGWPDDAGLAWRRILGAVRTFSDLEPALLGKVEELIDFVTAPS